MKTSLFVGAAITALLVSSSAFADKQHFVALVTSAAEVPAIPLDAGAQPCATQADGCTVSFTYDTDSHRICGHALLGATDLNVTAAHIHKGESTESGPVIVDFGLVGTTATKELAFDVDATTNDALTLIPTAFTNGPAADSIIYFNVHTTEQGNGAVRGNLTADPTNPTLDECLEFDGDGGTDGGGPTTTPTDGGGNTVSDAGSDTSTNTSDSSSSCSTAPGTSPGSVLLMLGAAIAVGSIVRARKKR